MLELVIGGWLMLLFIGFADGFEQGFRPDRSSKPPAAVTAPSDYQSP
jgi:hypothetical protein